MSEDRKPPWEQPGTDVLTGEPVSGPLNSPEVNRAQLRQDIDRMTKRLTELQAQPQSDERDKEIEELQRTISLADHFATKF